MIFDDNTAYQLYRIFVAIFGTLGMVVATSPMKKNYKKNMLFLGGYAIYAVAFTFFFMHFGGFLSFLRSVILTISLPGVRLDAFQIPLLHLPESRSQDMFSNACHSFCSLSIFLSV